MVYLLVCNNYVRSSSEKWKKLLSCNVASSFLPTPSSLQHFDFIHRDAQSELSLPVRLVCTVFVLV